MLSIRQTIPLLSRSIYRLKQSNKLHRSLVSSLTITTPVSQSKLFSTVTESSSSSDSTNATQTKDSIPTTELSHSKENKKKIKKKPLFDETRYYKQLYQFFRNDVGLTPGSKVLLCISGGVDSMAMLHLLGQVRTHFDPPLQLEVITFNHKLRAESDEEVEFVTRIASSYGCPVHVRVLDEHLRVDSGLQALARNWRRSECLRLINSPAFLTPTTPSQLTAGIVTGISNGSVNDIENGSIIQNVVNNSNVSAYKAIYLRDHATIAPEGPPRAYIATAHHADDALETQLLKLLRGVHLSHMATMQPVSDCGQFLKPMLSFTKAELLEYMTQKKLEWREDQSNQSTKYKRNEIRLDLIPLLEKLAGGSVPLRRRFQQLSEQSSELRKWLEIDAKTYMQLYVTFRRSKPDSRDGVVRFSATLAEMTRSGQFSKMPSLVKTEIFDAVCQILDAKARGYDAKVLSDVPISGDNEDVETSNSNSNSNQDGKRLFLSYSLLSACCDLCQQNFPLGVNTKTIVLSDSLRFTRTGASVRFDLEIASATALKGKDSATLLSRRESISESISTPVNQPLPLGDKASTDTARHSGVSEDMAGNEMVQANFLSPTLSKPTTFKGKLEGFVWNSIECLHLSDIHVSVESVPDMEANNEAESVRNQISVVGQQNQAESVRTGTSVTNEHLNGNETSTSSLNSSVTHSTKPTSTSKTGKEKASNNQKTLLNALNLGDPVTADLYNIPSNATLVFRRLTEGDRFQPMWHQYPIKSTSFLRGQNVPLHLRQDVLVVELRHHITSRVIAIPPFVSPQFSQVNSTGTNNGNRRKHIRVRVSNKFITDTK